MKQDTPLQSCVRLGYELGFSSARIAELTGTSAEVVRKTASRMKISKPRLKIPPEHQPDYRNMIYHKRIPAAEAAAILGLLPRPAAKLDIHA